MMVLTLLYGSLLYLVFFRFQLLPWNRKTQFGALVVGMCLAVWFFTGLKNFAPSSSQAVITGRVVDIAPQVGGEVIRVAVEKNVRVEKGEVLFEIDPTFFAAQVKELEATLALARLRLDQFRKLAEADAASQFEVEQTEAQIEQLEARLEGARFNLENTVVRAPFTGRAPKMFLNPGVQVSPARSVFAFVDTKQLQIYALMDQRAFPNLQIGDRALVNFPSLPGRVFETRVTEMASGIQEGQFAIGGQLDSARQRRMVRSFPIFLELPEVFPDELRKVGMAAKVTVMTDRAGPIGLYAEAMQWVYTSLDAIL